MISLKSILGLFVNTNITYRVMKAKEFNSSVISFYKNGNILTHFMLSDYRPRTFTGIEVMDVDIDFDEYRPFDVEVIRKKLGISSEASDCD